MIFLLHFHIYGYAGFVLWDSLVCFDNFVLCSHYWDFILLLLSCFVNGWWCRYPSQSTMIFVDTTYPESQGNRLYQSLINNQEKPSTAYIHRLLLRSMKIQPSYLSLSPLPSSFSLDHESPDLAMLCSSVPVWYLLHRRKPTMWCDLIFPWEEVFIVYCFSHWSCPPPSVQ